MKVQRSRPIGESWESVVQEDQSGFNYYHLETYINPKVFVTFPDGKQEKFLVKARYVDQWGPFAVYFEFEPIGDTTSELYLVGGPDFRLYGGVRDGPEKFPSCQSEPGGRGCVSDRRERIFRPIDFLF